MRTLFAALLLAGAASADQQSISLRVEGWHSKGDAYKTEDAVRQVKGVLRTSSDPAKKELTVVYDDGVVKEAAIIKAISAAGYLAHR